MKVLVLHNAVDPGAGEAERDVLVQVAAVSEALTKLGHRVQIRALDLNLESLTEDLQQQPVDLVFNLVESLAGSDRLQVLPAVLFEALGAAYTGSPTQALLLTGDKPRAKRILRCWKLPTPDWVEAPRAQPVGKSAAGRSREKGDRHHLPERPGGCFAQMVPVTFFPPRQEVTAGRSRARRKEKEKTLGPGGTTAGRRFLVKACWEHASLELEEETSLLVGADADAIRQELEARRRRTGRPWFAEEYIEGREFNLSLLAGKKGPELLPIAEIDFSAFPPDRLPIVGYRAKWDADSFEHHATPRRFEFPASDRKLLRRLEKLALACWQVFSLRGYARVDFRVDPNGNPWILEVNANPCLSPDAGFAAAAGQAGLAYHELIGRIVAAACPRRGRPVSVGFSRPPYG